MVDLEVIGSKQKVKVNALLDTGFAGYVCIPVKIAQELGLELCGSVETELADGQWVNSLVFNGQVHFLGATQHVEIIVSNSETSQVGVLLLSDCRLSIDFPTNKVRLTRKR
jgi:clan AA aspartic protease